MVTNIFTNGTVADATKVNTNFTDVETSAMLLGAQNAYQTLQANNVFQNKDFLFADEFVTSAGTNGTKTGGTSTFSNGYSLSIVNLAPADTTHNPGGFTSPSNAFDGNISTSAVKSITLGQFATGSYALGKTFTAKIVEKVGYNISTGNTSGGTASISIVLQTFNGTSWTNHTTISTLNGVITLGISIQGIRLLFSTTGSNTSSWTMTNTIYELNYFNVYNSSSTVIVDTKTLDGTENSLVVYADKTTPTNTTITLDISDGTTTLSAQPIESVIDISSLGAGTLSLTFNLATTDTTVTPTLLGYGGSIL